MVHLSFETLALQHKNLETFWKNVLTILCKVAIKQCKPVNCTSENLQAVAYEQKNL